MLDAADRALRLDQPDGIATALAGILDPLALTVSYASAGHPSPLLRDAQGRCIEFIGAGLPLGLRTADERDTQTIALERGSVLVLYTDGLIESTRNLEEGERRLRAALANDAVRGAQNVARAVHDAVLDEGARDDVAILALTVAPIADGLTRRNTLAVPVHGDGDRRPRRRARGGEKWPAEPPQGARPVTVPPVAQDRGR
jgi:serine phosphatase RsbU (regulator of sigma subunit)